MSDNAGAISFGVNFDTNSIFSKISSVGAESAGRLQGSFNTALSSTGKQFSSLGENMESIGEKASKLGTKLTLGITAPLVAAAKQVVSLTTAFDDGMAKISTISDNTQVSINDLGNALIDLSNKTGKSLSDLQEGEYEALSSGISTADSMQFMGIAARSSVGGFTDVHTAVDGLTTVLNSYGKSASEATDIANQMMVAQNLGKTTFGDMAHSIGLVADTSASCNISTKDLFSSLAVMTAHGIGTSEAISGLREAISNIIKPSKDATDQAKALGIDFSVAHLKSVGWAQFLTEIKDKTQGNTQEMGQLFGSVQALNSMITLSSESGMQLFNQSLEQMNSNTSYVDDAFNKVNSSSGKTLSNIFNELKNAATSFGKALENLHSSELTKLADSVSNAISKFNALSDTQKQAVANISLLAAGIGPATIGIGKLFEATGKADKAFGSALTSISKFASDGKTKITDFGEKAQKAFSTLGNTKPIQSLGNAIGTMGTKISSAASPVTSAISKLGSGIKSGITDVAGKAFNSLPGIAQKGLSGLSTSISSHSGAINSAFGKLGNGIVGGSSKMLSMAMKMFAPAAIIGLIIVGLGAAESKFGSQIDSMIQTFVQKAPGMISQFTEKILAQLPQLMESGTKLLLELINGINTVLPDLLKSAVQILSELVLGIAQQLPQLIPAALDLITTLANALLDNLPTILNAGLQLLVGLVEGITSDPQKLVDTIVDIVVKIATILIQNLPTIIEAGLKIIVALAAGLIKAIPELIAKIPEIVGALFTAFSDVDWGQIGKDIISGIGKGLKALGGALVDTLKNIGMDALKGFKSLFGIHSPSTVFASMGGYMIQGLINGLTDGKDGVNSTLNGLVDQSSLQGNLNNTLSGVSYNTTRSTQSQSNNADKLSGTVKGFFGTVIMPVYFNGAKVGEKAITAEELANGSLDRQTGTGTGVTVYV